MRPRIALVSLVLAAAGCGGGGGGTPVGPTTPPPDPPGETVTAVVFYDENGNNQLDPSEQGRVPEVEVTIAGRTARTEKLTGRVTIRGVPAGTHTLNVMPGTLPPYYVSGGARTMGVPQDAAQPLPGLGTRLEIGGNQPNVYMAFGDSITRGEGDPGGGYPTRLEGRLRAHFGDGSVVNRGADGTNSGEGVERVRRNIRGSTPAFTLVLYGTNDWNDVPCQDVPPCDVVNNLRRVLAEVKSAESLPFLATLIPTNPRLAAADRNDWIRATNDAIKQLGREEGVFVVDLFEAFQRQGGDVSRFFVDHVHPNAAGYEVIAEGFFQAIAFGRPVPTSSAGGPASLLRRPY